MLLGLLGMFGNQVSGVQLCEECVRGLWNEGYVERVTLDL